MIVDLNTKTFRDRYELDRHIEALLINSNEPLASHSIQGTREQLSSLSLSPNVTVYGVKVEEVAIKSNKKTK